MVCRIEAFIQELQLCAQILNVLVKVLEGFVSERGEKRSVILTSSENPVMLDASGGKSGFPGFVGQRFKLRIGEAGFISASKLLPSRQGKIR
jgi:hypothetical protein